MRFQQASGQFETLRGSDRSAISFASKPFSGTRRGATAANWTRRGVNTHAEACIAGTVVLLRTTRLWWSGTPGHAPLGEKYVRKSKKFHAHDEENRFKTVTLFVFANAKPISN